MAAVSLTPASVATSPSSAKSCASSRAAIVEIGRQRAGRDLVARVRKLDRQIDRDGPGRAGQRHDAGRQIDPFIDVMGDEDDGETEFAPQRAHQFLQTDARQRIDRAERLVHQQHGRAASQRARDRHALLHAAGQLPRIVPLEAGELHEADQLARARGNLGARQRSLLSNPNATLRSTVFQGNSERVYCWKT